MIADKQLLSGHSAICIHLSRSRETMSAALHGNGLTWKNSGLNTGANSCSPARCAVNTMDQRAAWDAWMGKSDRRTGVKAAARKGKPRATLNGSARGRAAIKAKKKTPAKRSARAAARIGGKGRSRQAQIMLPDGYRPSENEPFMSERHKTYFRNKLVAWKEEIVRQNRETLHILHEDSAQHAIFPTVPHPSPTALCSSAPATGSAS
jgi:DnaK suppressor protein